MKRRGKQSGYALLSVMFLAVVMMLVTMTATLNVMTQGRREKETELKWRGEQYVRAIRLYYRKNGKFPQKLEDLTKQEPGQPRFLRQSYKDPMNKADGSWRYIYVMPNGQLMGSVMNATIQGAAGVAPGAALFGAATNPGAAAQNVGQAPGTQGAPGTTAGGAGASGTSSSSDSNSSSGSSTPNQQQVYDADNPIIGGNIIGVASKIKEPSLMIYNKGTTYFEWEFIWNPLQSTTIAPGVVPGATPAGQPGQPGQPGQGQPGAPQPPTGVGPGTPIGPGM
jgi:hypothetical protein